MYFYEIWMRNPDIADSDTTSTNKFIDIPVLIKEYRSSNNELVNQSSDESIWQLSRRFFVIDNLSGIQSAYDIYDRIDSNVLPRYARFA